MAGTGTWHRWDGCHELNKPLEEKGHRNSMPRHSMGLPHMPTLTPKTTPTDRQIWQSHGVFGMEFITLGRMRIMKNPWSTNVVSPAGLSAGLCGNSGVPNTCSDEQHMHSTVQWFQMASPSPSLGGLDVPTYVPSPHTSDILKSVSTLITPLIMIALRCLRLIRSDQASAEQAGQCVTVRIDAITIQASAARGSR